MSFFTDNSIEIDVSFLSSMLTYPFNNKLGFHHKALMKFSFKDVLSQLRLFSNIQTKKYYLVSSANWHFKSTYYS